jgi:hypothetical protein
MIKRKSKISWNDLQNASQKELKGTYRMNDRDLEKAVRHHLDGATQVEMRKEYDKFYRRK